MSLPDLAAVLWRQRELLERLSYRMECEQLLMAAGRIRWLRLATAEVETVLDELRVVELQRAAVADDVARELGLPQGASLEQLAAGAQPPWTEVLLEHRQVLLTLTGELAAVAETNRQLVLSGAGAVQAALTGLRAGAAGAGSDEGAARGYDARGRTGSFRAGPGTRAVDRTL